MARLPCYVIPGQPQHIIQRGNNREPIFADESDYLFYIECLKQAAQDNELRIHSYVLMTNHVHILATPEQENSISKTLQSIGRRYVQYFNYTYDRTGTLWEGRYKATLIDSTQYLLTCMRYIELNPVRSKQVKKPIDYRWSSFEANALGKADHLIQPHQEYAKLARSNSDRQKRYRALFRSSVNEQDLEAIRNASNKGWALGNDRFREKIEKLAGRRAAPKPRGRPRKKE